MKCPHCGKEISTPTKTKCNKCGKEIVFLMTPKGKKMPVDADSWDGQTNDYDWKTHKSHFDTCTAIEKKKDEKEEEPF